MLNFEFQNPTKILFGEGQIAAIGREIPENARILITYGGGSVLRNGVLDEVKSALSGRQLFEFGGIEPNPTYETLMKGLDIIKAQSINFLLAVGGGSVIDGTKFLAAAACWELGDPWDILLHAGKGIHRALPLGTVLTLPATGSEMNCGAVISRANRQINLPAGGGAVNAGVHAVITQSYNEKLFFTNPLVYPRFSVLDPSKSYTLPARQIGNGIIDSFVHVTEQYLTYVTGAKVQDRLAEGLLLTLIEEGPRALAEPENYAVRANLMWTATLALNGLIGAGVPQDWTTHMIGHELTALFGMDHAQTLAVVLPALLTLQLDEKQDKLVQYGERIWGITEGAPKARAEAAIAQTRAFFESVGVATRLSDYGVQEENLGEVLERLNQHGFVILGEHQSITLERVRQILLAAL
ncbi:MAG: iron-containing alcohol dehydrogenase [Aeromonadaceae bacterium]|nr:iron-containing alcohol dehydrogenase [Aeromonadaceae bacterium]